MIRAPIQAMSCLPAPRRTAPVRDGPSDYIALTPPGISRRWPGFPFLLLLIPESRERAEAMLKAA
jgi:hypothetical protein